MSGEAGETLDLAFSDPRESGEPVLFVHGFSHHRRVWDKLAGGLAPDFRPIAVDLRGHGASPWSIAGEYDLRCYAQDLPVLLDSLGIDRAHVVGHSLGGNVSTLFAARHPDRIRSLVLVDTGPSLEASGTTHVTEEVENVLRSFESVAEYRAHLARIHPIGDGEILDGLASDGLVERLDGRFELALDPGVLGAAEAAAPGDPASNDLVGLERELWRSLASLRCPVLLVRGGLSAILSEKVAQEMVGETLAEGRLVNLPRAGHAVMIDDGPGLLDAISQFLSDVAS